MSQALAEFNYEQLEQQMEASAVLLLQEMHQTADPVRSRELFDQAADQEASLFSEVLDGAVITDFKFETKEGRLYLLQPNGVTDWQKMHEHGVLRAEAKAAKDAAYKPYVSIAAAELAEARRQELMASSNEPAVMVKLSLCGDDVMLPDQLKKLGRNPETQRAFLRVSVFDGQAMHIHSRSIDGLNLADGRKIVNGWGLWEEAQMALEPDATSIDILENQIYFNESQMSISQMHQLANRLVGAYDQLQTERAGRLYKAGRAPEGVDTYKFVLDNQDLLSAHMDSLASLAAQTELPIGHIAAVTNDLRYDIMSSFKRRLDGTWVEYGSLGESVARAGSIERRIGTQYGGCDMVIGANLSEQAGYVNAQAGGRVERAKLIKNLRKEVVSKGSCSACGAKGNLFGCGFCGACNKKWCDIFEKTGEQTPINKLAKYRPRQQESIFGKTETLSEYWARLGRESELKKLQNEAELSSAT